MSQPAVAELKALIQYLIIMACNTSEWKQSAKTQRINFSGRTGGHQSKRQMTFKAGWEIRGNSSNCYIDL